MHFLFKSPKPLLVSGTPFPEPFLGLDECHATGSHQDPLADAPLPESFLDSEEYLRRDPSRILLADAPLRVLFGIG